MDLISRVPEFNLFDQAWKIFTPNPVKPAQYIGPKGSVKKSIIAEGCMVFGNVKNSVIFPGVTIEEGAEIEDSIVMSDCLIMNNAKIYQSIICEKVHIGKNAVIGKGQNIPNELQPNIYNSGITVISEETRIPSNIKIGKNVMIDINVLESDLNLDTIDSGKSVIKGGNIEWMTL